MTNDQAIVDHLIERVRHRFRYGPGWRLWFEHQGSGLFSPHRALENLRDAYLDSLAELPAAAALTARERHHREAATAASSQQWALWLLERDARMTAAPEEFDEPGPYRLRPEPPPWDPTNSPAFDALHERLFTIGRDHLQRFFSPARTRGGETPNVLIRTGSARGEGMVPELGGLYPMAAEILGAGNVVRVGARAWTNFPDSLTPSLALLLTGARLVFLEAPEKNTKNPPQAALLRWARGGTAVWPGLDRALHPLRLPTHFIVCGCRWRWLLLESELRLHCLTAEEE